MKLTEMSAFYGFGVFTCGLGYLIYEPFYTIGTTFIGGALILFGIKYHKFEK